MTLYLSGMDTDSQNQRKAPSQHQHTKGDLLGQLQRTFEALKPDFSDRDKPVKVSVKERYLTEKGHRI